MKPLCTSAVALLAALAIGACGSSKPGYCSKVSDFKTSVQDLGKVDLSGGTSAVKSAIDKVESSGKAVVSSAKSDFPTETTALESSLKALGTTAQQLTSPSTQKEALKQLPGKVAGVVSAGKSFESATSSKCS